MVKCEQTGILYIVATPIGNLGDMTYRAVETLKECSLILAEDTRHSRKLLQHYGIHTRLLSYHDHNEQQRAPQVLRYLQQGMKIALISDAGTPGVADPGFHIVRMAYEHGLRVSILPGPSALTSALSACGLPGSQHCFLGFLPRNRKEKHALLQKAKATDWRVVFFEVPHRAVETLELVVELWGEDHPIFMAREMSKQYEELRLTRTGALWQRLKEEGIQGEAVYILAPGAERVHQDPGEEALDAALQEIRRLMDQGIRCSEAIRRAAQRTKLPKNKLYRFMLDSGMSQEEKPETKES